MLTDFNKFEISATSEDNDTQNLKTKIVEGIRGYRLQVDKTAMTCSGKFEKGITVFEASFHA